MKDYMKGYIKSIDNYIINGDLDNIDDVIETHLIKIKFFMHERLIHFLVTMLFAIMTLLTFFFTLLHVSIGFIILVVLFIALLVPYILHYYYLENNVQYMYKQYDSLCAKKKSKKTKK